MKRTIIIGLGFFLAGCSALTQDLKETWDYAQGAEDVVLTAEQIDEFPYTAVYARMGEQAQSLMVLGFVDQGAGVERLNWLSAGGESVTTEYGRIVRTTDLAANVLATSNLSEDPLRCYLTQAYQGEPLATCPTVWERTLDASTESGPYVLSAKSRFQLVAAGTDEANTSVQLPKGQVSVTLLEEQGVFVLPGGQAGQAFTNRFWFTNDGHVVKSEQTLMPFLAPIQMTQVKWIGRND
ncbi:hypothetical protein CWE15_11445 [Aliidiomarina taiwanensis]|uniref:YjbF family lipoprotein n=1 Tax=Aliidiomarina taiwanensis TaxID=946228 RepID=A0A432WTP4_9GAMM|nr:YjbF family lipoprotein [Aliidiomarina taiwanensis]RUO37117.1 hypothetical protein CWE15_11445 [Aliidiomarina taiwanensis]